MINVYVKTQRLEEAFAIFLEMKSHRIDPTIVTYTSLIDGCGKCGNVTLALSLYNEVKSSDLELNMHLFNAVMNSGLINGCMFVIDEVMREIGVRQMKPNTITFNTLLSGCLRFDQLGRMKGIVEEMKGSGVEFSSVTQTTILQSVQLVRTAADLEEFVELLTTAGMTPSQVQGAQAVKDLIQVGRLTLARELVIRLIAAGCPLPEDVFIDIIELAGVCANLQVLQWANETAIAFRMSVRSEVFYAQLHAFANLDDVEKVGEMYAQRLEIGRVIPAGVLVRVFQCFLGAGDDRAFEVLDQILNGPKGALSPEIIDKLVQSLFQHDLADRIVQIFQTTQDFPQFTTLTSDCIIMTLLKTNTPITSLARLSPSLSSIILLVKRRRNIPIPSQALLDKIEQVKTPPTEQQFVEFLQAMHTNTDFGTLWAAFRHFLSLGAVLGQTVMDLITSSLEQLQSYDDISFLLNAARDSGVVIPRSLESAAVIAALEVGNFADALSIHEEIEALHGTLSAEAEKKYEEALSPVRSAFPANQRPSPNVRIRQGSRGSPRSPFRSAFLD
jgi:pentatricopeptide repeat protein